jgi:methionine-S-sulfoxide reductase
MTRFLSALIVAAVFAATPLRAEPTAAPAAVPLAAVATFAAGCYWCVESDFDKVKGVIETTSGFMGGHVENPTYEQVGSGKTGHLEVVRVTYDPSIVSYQKLLDHFWVNVDPLDGGGQFCDRGYHYSPGIFTYGEEQKALAEASKKKIEDSKRFAEQPIVVQILPASAFTPAHDQDFYKTNSVRYKFYRAGCGRDARLKQLWGDKAGS